MRRRTLLNLGFVSAAALGAAGGAAWWWGGRDRGPAGPLSEPERAIFRAVARGVLDGTLPNPPAVQSAMLDGHLERVAAAVAMFPPQVRTELTQLLQVLANPVGRRLLAGLDAPWDTATIPQLHASFEDMRRSRLAVRQQAFLALRDLTNAAFYAEPGTWAFLDYPGPRPV
jgi:hypothetical protein